MLKRTIKIAVILLILIGLGVFTFNLMRKKTSNEVIQEIMPRRGAIQSVISATATILPKNRLEVRPPVNGRVEEVLVKEGEKVRAGQVIARMSSTERAALLDAARGKGEESYRYWQDAYKPIPLISPIDGEVIVATIQPGQTVSISDAVIVLSDLLITRAQVDETDIGKIKLAQKAVITLDAYKDIKIEGTVEHIYYESRMVNNVTIYEVDVISENVPHFLRSGMNAAIDFKEENRQNALLLPQNAVHTAKNEIWVLVKDKTSGDFVKRAVTLGISDGKDVEILSGLNDDEIVILKTKKYALEEKNPGKSPFMPDLRRR